MKLDEFYTLEKESIGWHLTRLEYGDINPDTGKPIMSKKDTWHATMRNALVHYVDESLNPNKPVLDLLDQLNLLIAWAKKI